MSQHNSMMEWVEQTRRINKSVDQICNDAIDAIIKILPYCTRVFVDKHHDFFNRFCSYYHKPNPVKLIRKIKKGDRPTCFKCRRGDGDNKVMEFADGSIERCWAGVQMVRIQWWEIIDFIYERPELVNPNILNDDYVVAKINDVCKGDKKNNPLKNGFIKRLGRHWKDDHGKWRTERRRRF